MSVRAKFKVVSIKRTQFMDGPGSVVELSPVVSGSAENKEFYKWTPSGRIELGTINESAAEQFEIGKDYYVDFSKADE